MWGILEKAQHLHRKRQRVCLVTLVESDGSTYRRPGSKMIVGFDEYMEGAISGGCLERDAALHAKAVMETGLNKVIHYQLDDDAIFGMGLGCGGSIDLLLETGTESWLPAVLSARTGAVIVKRIGSESASGNPGTIAIYRNDAVIWQAPDHRLDMERIAGLCAEVSDRRYPAVVEYSGGDQTVRLFLDLVIPPHPLVVFGGGDDAIPVAALAGKLGFEVTVTDHRSVNLNDLRFPNCRLVRWEGDATMSRLPVDGATAVMIMSHHIERDAEALEAFGTTPAYYIGLLGPKKRLLRLRERMTADSADGQSVHPLLFSPVGLDIGSETPEEVAVSILAEIIAVRNGHTGGMLREKTDGIHKTSPAVRMVL